jgi:hypothetical protein
MDPKALDSTKDLKISKRTFGLGSISAEEAEYMELKGAEKDADCRKVDVDGGVSSDLGCCDKFQPEDDEVQQFRCGTCEYRIIK